MILTRTDRSTFSKSVMIIIFVIVNIAHHILTVNLYFHNLQIFHNYILSCRRIIPCIFSHFISSCIQPQHCSLYKTKRFHMYFHIPPTHASIDNAILTLLSICSSTISHINICTSISITYHIKMRSYASIEPHWIHKLFHRHATVTIHVSYYPSILFTTSSRCIPFEPLISTISSGCITESRYKATSPLSLKL